MVYVINPPTPTVLGAALIILSKSSSTRRILSFSLSSLSASAVVANRFPTLVVLFGGLELSRIVSSNPLIADDEFSVCAAPSIAPTKSEAALQFPLPETGLLLPPNSDLRFYVENAAAGDLAGTMTLVIHEDDPKPPKPQKSK